VDTAAAHGEPLGVEEVRETKRAYGGPEDAEFLVPDGVYEHFAGGIGTRGRELRTAWEALFDGYRDQQPALATDIEQMQRRQLPDGWDADTASFDAGRGPVATRKGLQRRPQRHRAAGPVAGARLGRLTDSTAATTRHSDASDARRTHPGRDSGPGNELCVSRRVQWNWSRSDEPT
jgi:transketolase